MERLFQTTLRHYRSFLWQMSYFLKVRLFSLFLKIISTLSSLLIGVLQWKHFVKFMQILMTTVLTYARWYKSYLNDWSRMLIFDNWKLRNWNCTSVIFECDFASGTVKLRLPYMTCQENSQVHCSGLTRILFEVFYSVNDFVIFCIASMIWCKIFRSQQWDISRIDLPLLFYEFLKTFQLFAHSTIRAL